MILFLVGVFPFLLWWSKFWIELIVSFSISILNSFIGYYIVLISISKSDSEFYKNVYGSMLIRMLCLFGFSIYIIGNNFVLTIPYMLFFITFFVIHQWTEIFGWLNELPKHKIQPNL